MATDSAASVRRSVVTKKPVSLRSIAVTGSLVASRQPLRSSRRKSAARMSAALSLAGKILPVDSIFVGTPSASINATSSRGPSAASAECRNFP